MSDLFGVNGAAVAMGNARMQQVRDFNDRVKEHNDNVLNQIQGLREAQKSADTIQAIKTQATNLWTAKDIPGKVAEFNKYYADRAAGKALGTNPVQNTVNNLKQQAQSKASGFLDQAKSTTQAGGEAISEGANAAESVSDVAKSATSAVGKGLTSTLEGAAAAKDAAGGIAGKVSGALGKVGVLGSAALGGMDLYEDIAHGGIQGNNNWEKASNLLQIGGTIGDLAGTFFPPAKLIGGVLDLASGLTDTVGEKLDEDKQASDLQTQQQQETEKPMAVAAPTTVTTGRTQ
jgi:hypothetical protein